MSLTFDDPSPVIGWPTTRKPTRPGFWARLRERLYGPDPTDAPEHTGADETWAPSDELEPGDTGRHHRGSVHVVDRGYRLSPAALQRVTGTVEQIPSTYEDTTGLLNTPNVPGPAETRDQVLAEMRDALTAPPADDDQITDTTTTTDTTEGEDQ